MARDLQQGTKQNYDKRGMTWPTVNFKNNLLGVSSKIKKI